ncbi:lipase 3-like [Haematobia irritans]|uniref:lipase 3-like n=1 Tax=Haematobia irritans TaxID=7368 RepID=UPI003F503ABE
MDSIKNRSVILNSLLIIPILIIVVQLQYPPEPNTKTIFDRIERAGYASKSYDVYTKDGYGIRIFRLRNSSSSWEDAAQISTRPIVLLMHGMTTSADCWILESLTHPLAYDLVNSGYDVWLGNTRGNTYGQMHLHMSSYDREFWRFSLHEVGTIDLPHIMDFILTETQADSLHYVGHSQGTTIALILLSTNGEYNRKFKSITMLAPSANLTFVTTPLRYISPIMGRPLYSTFEDWALFRPMIVRKLLGMERCRRVGATSKYCSFFVYNFFGGYSAYINRSMLPEIYDTHPATCSIRQILHYAQIHQSRMFRQYDFGPEGNLLHYNHSIPPEYNLRNLNLRFPIHLFYSRDDQLSALKDVEILAEILGNSSISHFIDLKHFAHIDFIWASNIREVINRPVLTIIRNVEKELEKI